MNTALKLITQRGEDIAYVDMRYTNGFLRSAGAAMPPAPPAGTVATMLKRTDRNLIVGLDIAPPRSWRWWEKWADGSIELLAWARSPRAD